MVLGFPYNELSAVLTSGSNLADCSNTLLDLLTTISLETLYVTIIKHVNCLDWLAGILSAVPALLHVCLALSGKKENWQILLGKKQ